MRILHLDSGRGMRGGQWQVARLIEGLIAGGAECTLLARGGGELLELARRKGWRTRTLAALAFERGYDLIHAHDSRTHTLAAWLGGAPLVVSRRVAFGGPISGALERWKYGRPAGYIAVSGYVKSMLAARGVAPEKIHVVYDGVPLLPKREAAPGGARVVAPANLEDPEKGGGLAVEAVRLAGFDLTLSRDLERDLATASAFLYLTRSEGLGSAVLLALSAGVPVVASKTGGLIEIVRHGENGFLVENEAAAVAGALRELLGDPLRAARMGEAGREMVAAGFTVNTMVRRTMEVYRKVLS